MQVQRNKFNLVVIGGRAVGKTALIHQYMLNQLMEEYKHTVLDTYRKLIAIDSVLVDLYVTDTEGDPSEYSDSDAFIFVFSTTSRDSFASVYAYKAYMAALCQQESLIALVGTKTDLTPQEVSFEEGSRFAQTIGASYFHISVTSFQQAQSVFESVLRQGISPTAQAILAVTSNSKSREIEESAFSKSRWVFPIFTACLGQR